MNGLSQKDGEIPCNGLRAGYVSSKAHLRKDLLCHR